eukprot:766214-Hanusia_phi.AAC.1
MGCCLGEEKLGDSWGRIRGQGVDYALVVGWVVGFHDFMGVVDNHRLTPRAHSIDLQSTSREKMWGGGGVRGLRSDVGVMVAGWGDPY